MSTSSPLFIRLACASIGLSSLSLLFLAISIPSIYHNANSQKDFIQWKAHKFRVSLARFPIFSESVVSVRLRQSLGADDFLESSVVPNEEANVGESLQRFVLERSHLCSLSPLRLSCSPLLSRPSGISRRTSSQWETRSHRQTIPHSLVIHLIFSFPGKPGPRGTDGEDITMDQIPEAPCAICPAGPIGPR